MKRVLTTLAIAVLAASSLAQTITERPWYAYKGSTKINSNGFDDLATCAAWIQSRANVGTYKCEGSSIVTVACPTAPVIETQTATCAEPLKGSWTQQRSYAAAAYPACWISGAWGPSDAPADACVEVVPPAPAGFINVSWVAPTTNADGSPLTDLAGFRVHYGTVPGIYATVVTIADPLATSYRIEPLPPGTYFVIVTAFDTSGNESADSVDASKVIR
jgi:hypothetical protein